MKSSKSKSIVLSGLVILGLVSPAVLAELIYGEIAAIDTQNNSVTLSPRQATIKDLPQADVNLHVTQDAFQKSDDISSIDQLAVGDEIIVEADRLENAGDWEVQSLMRAEAFQKGGDLQKSSATILDPNLIITGRVVSVDPDNKSITVTDYVTGFDRKLRVEDQATLREVKVGEVVTFRPQPQQVPQSMENA